MRRESLVLLLAVAAAAVCLVVGCNDTTPKTGGGETGSLGLTCVQNSECGPLSCVDSVCTRSCVTDAACQGLGTAAVCQTDCEGDECLRRGLPEKSVCLESCASDADCTCCSDSYWWKLFYEY